MSILVIAEHDNNEIKGATLNTIAAATKISDDITLMVAGSDCSSVISEAQTLEGVSKILSTDDEAYKNFLAEDLSELVMSVASNSNISWHRLQLLERIYFLEFQLN